MSALTKCIVERIESAGPETVWVHARTVGGEWVTPVEVPKFLAPSIGDRVAADRSTAMDVLFDEADLLADRGLTWEQLDP